MSTESRAELARIARGVRRVLERETARGLGEILARDAVAAVPWARPPAPAGDELAAPPDRTPVRALASARPPAPAVAAGPAVDLFGNPLPSPVVSTGATVAQPPPAFPAPVEYHPRTHEARAAILAASLPVLEQAATEIRECRKCGLCETRTNAVPGVGSARSGIVFVGEAPGADEDAQGEPFVGRAGQLLTRIIQAMEDAKLVPGVPLSRDTVYICNVLKCRPPENRNPLPHEIEQCSPYLIRQLEALKPRVICCLGKFAAELLLGIKGTIASLRGRVYTYAGAKLIVTYHPAACLRNPGYKRPVWEDMQLLAREYLSD
jgi:DNA polymerase